MQKYFSLLLVFRILHNQNKQIMRIIDNSLTPVELARLKYYRLYEEQTIFKSKQKSKTFLNKLIKWMSDK